MALLVGVITLAVAQSPPTTLANSSFVGTWQGKMNDLPAIDLTVNDAGESLSGFIVFYMHKRSDPNGPWHVEGQDRTPLLVPHVEGKTLTFEVEHHKCHDCTELGPNVKFRMELTGPNEARLWNLEHQHPGKDLGSGLKLLRRTR
jgi:hypothetical protein